MSIIRVKDGAELLLEVLAFIYQSTWCRIPEDLSVFNTVFAVASSLCWSLLWFCDTVVS